MSMYRPSPHSERNALLYTTPRQTLRFLDAMSSFRVLDSSSAFVSAETSEEKCCVALPQSSRDASMNQKGAAGLAFFKF